MSIFISNLNNMGGTATEAQEGVVRVAKQLGIRELGISYYYMQPDFINEIGDRLRGIFAATKEDDILIFQYPSWVGPNYDECFVNYAKDEKKLKLIVFVQDVQQLMFNSDKLILDMEINVFNKADILILPSRKMHRILVENGLKEDIPVEYQTIWEMPGEKLYTEHNRYRKMIFIGSASRFPFVLSYKGKTKLELYQYGEPQRANDESFEYKGFFSSDQIQSKIAEGGFGLVWSDDDYFDRYYSLNQPYKIGSILASGIPVIVRRGSTHEKFVVDNGIGFAVSSLEEADVIIQNLSDSEFAKLYSNVAKIQRKIVTGVYTRELLQNSIDKLINNEENKDWKLTKENEFPADIINERNNIFYSFPYSSVVDTTEYRKIAETATEFGFKEIPIHVNVDDALGDENLNIQMDGSFSAFRNDSILFMQYPSGGGYRYDKSIFDHAKRYTGAKVVVILHQDFNSLTEEEKNLLESTDYIVEYKPVDGEKGEFYRYKQLIDAVIAVRFA